MKLPGDWRDETPSIGARVKSAALWSAGLGWLVPNLSLMTIAQQLRGAHNIERWNRLYCAGQIALTGCKIKYHLDSRVDPHKQYLFIQNHSNHFDHVLAYNASPQFKQGIEMEKHFSYPFYGWFMKSRGTIPVPMKRQGRYQALRERAQKTVAGGASLVMFPEGTRTLDGRLGEFKKGAFLLARDLNIELVPTTVTGAYCFMRKGSLQIRPGQAINVYCDAPVSCNFQTDDEREAIMKRVHDQMSKRIDAYFATKYGSKSSDVVETAPQMRPQI